MGSRSSVFFPLKRYFLAKLAEISGGDVEEGGDDFEDVCHLFGQIRFHALVGRKDDRRLVFRPIVLNAAAVYFKIGLIAFESQGLFDAVLQVDTEVVHVVAFDHVVGDDQGSHVSDEALLSSVDLPQVAVMFGAPHVADSLQLQELAV